MISSRSKPLTEAGIRVIPVGVGNAADRQELKKATDDPNNVITVPNKETPKDLADKIIARIEQG